jgi:hypothetical protein
MQAFCQILCKTEVQHHVHPVKWELLPPVAQKKTLKLQQKKMHRVSLEETLH